jgi:hypothetical protein
VSRSGRFTHRVDRYAEAVLDGGVLAGPLVRAAAARHFRDRERAAGDARWFQFSTELADQILGFFEDILRLPDVNDEDGNPVTSNLADYPFISAAELPSFEVIHMETPTPRNPLGAKGIGESGTIGATPALQSAIVDAVAHLGIRHIDMPATPERMWRAITSVNP